MISADNIVKQDRLVELAKRTDFVSSYSISEEGSWMARELLAARARIAELEAACKALYADAHGDVFDSGPSFVPQGLSQEDRDACNAGSMAAIQLSKIQPSKLQSEGWVEVAAILRRLGGQTT